MSFLSKIGGTFSALFQVGKSGPQIKNNAGVIEHRNAADAAFVIARGADPVGADDLTTKRYADLNTGAYAPGTFALADGQFIVMTTRLILTTNQRATLAGTSTLRIT